MGTIQAQCYFIGRVGILEPATVIRVLIADDYRMVRLGLVTILSDFDEIEIIGEAVDGEMAISLCDQHTPDVVLMDINMPRLNGIEATRQIRASHPNTQVVALSSTGDGEIIQQVLQAGAISYLMKNVTGEELVRAIRLAREGQSTLAPEAAQHLMHLTTQRHHAQYGQTITRRELEVLALMKDGLSNLEISAQLALSSSTVKNHVSNILFKLGATSRTQAVALAIQHGLVKK